MGAPLRCIAQGVGADLCVSARDLSVCPRTEWPWRHLGRHYLPALELFTISLGLSPDIEEPTLDHTDNHSEAFPMVFPFHTARSVAWTGLSIAAVAILLFTAEFVSAASLDLPLIWTVETKTYLESSASVADIDGDGVDEILAAGREEMIALEGDGTEMWRWRTKMRYMTYPSVFTREDKSVLIYGADTAGLFTCLDGNGKVVWQAQLSGGSSWAAPAICDLDGDGTPEVIGGDERGTVWAFNALTGEVLWKAEINGMVVSPAVGDLDGDGKPEIVVGTSRGVLAALNGSGKILWQRTIGGVSETWGTPAPITFVDSSGQGRIAAAASEGRAVCLDALGNILWSHATRGPVAASLSAGDLDLDGKADVFLITQLGVVYRFDEDGTLLWEIDMQGRTLGGGAIIDINNDGSLEYVLSTQDGRMMVLSDEGEIVFEHHFGNRTINITPAFGELIPDSPGLEMVITGGESGKVFCFGTQATPNSAAHWTAYRGNVEKTGYWAGLVREGGLQMVPTNLAWNRVCAGDGVRFSISNPSPTDGPLMASASCTRPDGSRQAATTRVVGEDGVLTLPVDAVLPGTYRFEWSLADAEGVPLLARQKDVSLHPFSNERALTAKAVCDLRAAAEVVKATLPLSTEALLHQANLLEVNAQQVRDLQDLVAGGTSDRQQKAVEKTAQILRASRKGIEVSRIALQAANLGTGTSLVAFEDKSWDNRNVDRRLPSRVRNPVTISRRVVPREHEGIGIHLFNITGHDLRVQVSAKTQEGGPSLTLRKSVDVPTSLGEVAWDPLPELDESSTLVIPSLETREAWLDIDIGSATPGTHRIEVTFHSLNGAGVLDAPTTPHSVSPPETIVEVDLEVLPFEMASPGSIRLCSWARYGEVEIRDLLAHGNNVFVFPHGSPILNDAKEVTGYDYTNLDSLLVQLAGYDTIPLLNGIPSLPHPFQSEDYAEDLKHYLTDLVKHMASMGFDTDHFGLYPIDEPGGHGWHSVDRLVEFGKMVKAANPDVMMYVDGGGELPMFEAMAPVMDIWTPGITMLREKTPEMEVMRTTGKMLWSYNCAYPFSRPVGANLKNINILGEYRTAALFALRHDATGIGFWCYNIGEDPWGRTTHEYSMVYPGKDGPVTSRRWEALREGLEDYRIVTALREKMKQDESLSEGTKERIQRLIEDHLPDLLDRSWEEMTLGLSREVLDASMNEERFAAFHKEMMDCVAAVCTERK